MVNLGKSVTLQYVVKVEFMLPGKYEVHKFCFFTDAIACLKKFFGEPTVVALSFRTEFVQPRDYNPLFD